jgi:hypothetical protein
MHEITLIDDLPQPVRVMAKNFYEADRFEPEIYEVTKSEYDTLADNEDAVTQLLYWRAEHKFYAVLAGDAKRKIQSQIIQHDPFFKETSILAFYEVGDADIREWKTKYGRKMLDPDHALEMYG